MEQENELEKLKREILSEIKIKGKSEKRIPWGSGIVTGVLVVLTLFSVVQAVQSATILSKINSGAFQSASAAPAAVVGSSLPTNVQNLPNMVGGC